MQRRGLRTLQVCRCAVCVDERTLHRLLTTPVRQMERDLLCQYTNSAHGDLIDPDELLYFIPRYLELIAADDEPDYNNSGAVLRRLGDLRHSRPGYLTRAQVQALDDWLHAWLAHVARAEASRLDDPEAGLIASLWSEMGMALAAGYPGATIDAAMRAALDGPGLAALVFLADEVCGRLDSSHATDLYAARYATADYRNRLIAAITGPDWAALADGIVTGGAVPGLDDAQRKTVARFRDLPGTIWRGMFHLHEDGTARPLF
jgi:hypothetical protein